MDNVQTQRQETIKDCLNTDKALYETIIKKFIPDVYIDTSIFSDVFNFNKHFGMVQLERLLLLSKTIFDIVLLIFKDQHEGQPNIDEGIKIQQEEHNEMSKVLSETIKRYRDIKPN